MKYPLSPFRHRLKICRQTRNMTQAQLAEMVGLARETVGQFECGNKLPDFDSLIKLSIGLCVTSDFLLGIGDGCYHPQSGKYTQ